MIETPARDVIKALAVADLAPPARPLRIEEHSREAVLGAITRERLTGPAVAAWSAGALALTPTDLDELLTRHEDQLALDLRLEAALCDAVNALDGLGIPYRCLKGPTVAHLDYDAPELRSFGDVDILVPGAAFDEAVRVLGRLGYRRRFVEPRTGFDARFSKGACLEREDGVEVDLHRALAPGAYGMKLGRLDLFARPPRPFVIGATRIDGFSRELALVHACFHAALGDYPPRLVPLRDVAVLLRAGADESDVLSLLERTECLAVAKRAIDLVQLTLGIHLEGPLATRARAHVPTMLDRWAMRTYASERRSYAGQAALSFWVMPSARDRIAYARALAFPSHDYVRAREGGYARRAGRAARLASSWRPR